MNKNLGAFDRVIRVMIAAIIFTLYFTGIIPGILGIVLTVFGVVLVITSLIIFCPLYLPFGLNTCSKKVAHKN